MRFEVIHKHTPFLFRLLLLVTWSPRLVGVWDKIPPPPPLILDHGVSNSIHLLLNSAQGDVVSSVHIGVVFLGQPTICTTL